MPAAAVAGWGLTPRAVSFCRSVSRHLRSRVVLGREHATSHQSRANAAWASRGLRERRAAMCRRRIQSRDKFAALDWLVWPVASSTVPPRVSETERRPGRLASAWRNDYHRAPSRRLVCLPRCRRVSFCAVGVYTRGGGVTLLVTGPKCNSRVTCLMDGVI